MSTKITTPELFNLSSNNTAATQLPVFTTSTRPTPTTSTVQVEYLVVAGGGGGGNFDGGGGGAGGYLTNYNGTPISITTSNLYTVTVGEGGVGGQKNVITSGVGGNSVFDTIISYGGGGGASDNNTGPSSDGGSGGGAAGGSNPTIGLASPPGQGYNGGNSSGNLGGGGGGASEAGNTDGQGHGGDGLSNSITGTPTFYAGGGGGDSRSGGYPGGDGGGASGSGSLPSNDGTPNTGGGGGAIGGTTSYQGGSGGSGIVILRYPTSSSLNITTTGSLVYTESTHNSDTVLQFTEGSGNFGFAANNNIAVGEMIFNSTTGKVEYWDGFKWNMIKDEAVAPPLEPNQILWLDANNTSSWTGSGTTWYDVSGNGYNATITTPVPSTGTVNGATYLNLSTRADYFTIPYSVHSGGLNMTSGNVITWLYWMRLPNIPTSVNGLNVIHKATPTGSTTNQVYIRYYDPSVEGFNPFVYDSNGNADVNPGYVAPVNNNDWFMFVASYNFPTNNFQFHRYQPNTATYNNTSLGSVSPQWTGNSDIYLLNEPGSTYGGYGELGEIRAYDTTFTTAELDAKYNAQKGKYGIT